MSFGIRQRVSFWSRRTGRLGREPGSRMRADWHQSRTSPCSFQAVLDLLEAHPELRACVIGTGARSRSDRTGCRGHPRVELVGTVSDYVLRETAVLISANETEQFGISYLEALSQGCSVVMPACGGGLEIAPDLIGSQVQLVPLPLERATLYAALSRALGSRARRLISHPTLPRLWPLLIFELTCRGPRAVRLFPAE